MKSCCYLTCPFILIFIKIYFILFFKLINHFWYIFLIILPLVQLLVR